MISQKMASKEITCSWHPKQEYKLKVISLLGVNMLKPTKVNYPLTDNVK